MSDWLQHAKARAEQQHFWSPQQKLALQQLQTRPWPSRKVEQWKYTPVNAIERGAFAQKPAFAAQVSPLAGQETLDIVFVNGELQSQPQSLPAGLSIHSLTEHAQAGWAADYFAQCKPDRHLFGLVNDCLADNGVIIDIATESKIALPLRIINVVSQDAEVHNRVLVRVGDGASVSVIEQAEGNESSLLTAFAEYFVGASAKLEHYRFALRIRDAISVGGSHFKLQKEAQLNSTVVGFGSVLSRLDVDVMHCGENAFAKINAIYLLDGEEIFDLHSNIEHEIGHCVTDETVRGIVGGKAKAVFNGRIHIHRDAQKTLAELSNKNLLLADTAQVNTKPELEIYADDVRCAHGATVAELDKAALYYLTSRGISKEQALIMLNFGFVNALVDEMPNQHLAEWLRPQLQNRFAQMQVG
ncbi:MAG: Fe-S cluster assembly protein SufD [Aestuariibacter sp.]